MELKIKRIVPVIKNGEREAHVHFDDGHTVIIGKYNESWAQWGAPMDYRWKCVNIADNCNRWIHGVGSFPY